MGVDGLWTLLACCALKAELAQLHNKRLAIDTSVWLVQFVRGMRGDDGQVQENAHLKGFFNRICKLLYYGVRPVFVFDGARPELKARALQARAEARKKAETRARDLAREILVAKVKKRVLSFVAADGKSLSEADLRKALAAVDEVASELSKSATAPAALRSVILEKPTAISLEADLPSRPQISNPRLAAEYAAKEKFDEDLRNFEARETRMTLSEAGAALSSMQINNLVSGVMRNQRFGFGANSNIMKRAIASEPGKEAVLFKGADAEERARLFAGGGKSSESRPSKKLAAANTSANAHVDDAEFLQIADDDVAVQPRSSTTRMATSAPSAATDVAMLEQFGGFVVDDDAEPEAFAQNSNNFVDHDAKNSAAADDDDRFEEEDLLIVDGDALGDHVSAHFENEEAALLKRFLEDDAAPEEVEAAEDASWNCRRCTYRNKWFLEQCEMCQAHADGRDFDQNEMFASSNQVAEQGLAEPSLAHPGSDFGGLMMSRARANEKISENRDDEDLLIVDDDLADDLGGFSDAYDSSKPHASVVSAPAVVSDPETRIPKNRDDEDLLIVDDDAVRESGSVEEKSVTLMSNRAGIQDAATRADAVSEIPKNRDVEDLFVVDGRPVNKNGGFNVASESINTRTAAVPGPSKAPIEESEIPKNREDEDLLIVDDDVADAVGDVEEASVGSSVSNAGDATSGRHSVDELEIPKNREVSDFAGSAASGQLSQRRTGHWTCDACGDDNSADSDTCFVCGSKPVMAENVNLPVSAAETGKVIAQSRSRFLVTGDEALAGVSVGPSQVSQESGVVLDDVQQRVLEDLNGRERALVMEENKQQRLMEKGDPEAAEEIKEVLNLFGIPWVVAPMEAEAQCAFLQMEGLVDGVVTEDSDMFLVGALDVYKHLFRQDSHPMRFRSDDVVRKLGLSRVRLIQLAYLLGSDYCAGLLGVGIVLGMEVLGEFSAPEDEDDDDDEVRVDEDPRDMLEDVLRPLIAFRNWLLNPASKRAPGLRKKLQKVTLPLDFPDPAIARAYLQPDVDRSKQQFQWSMPKWDKLQEFAVRKFGWAEDRIDTLIQPVKAHLEELERTGRITQKTLLEFFTVRAPDPYSEKIQSKRLRKAVAKLNNERYVPSPKKPAEVHKKQGGKKRSRATALPKTAFGVFRGEAADALRRENPDMTPDEIRKAVSAQWRLVEDRSFYELKAEQNRAAINRAENEENIGGVVKVEEGGRVDKGDDKYGDDDGDDDDVDEVVVVKKEKREEDVEEQEAKAEPDLAKDAKRDLVGLLQAGGPPFERSKLRALKMNQLRVLCHQYGLKPSIRKEDVIWQLSMLSAEHEPVSEKALASKLSKIDKRKRAEQEQDDIDQMLEGWRSGSSKIYVNRAPLLMLWAAIVGSTAHHFPWRTSLTLAAALAGVFSRSKAKRLGIRSAGAADIDTGAHLTLFGTRLPVTTAQDGLQVAVNVETGMPYNDVQTMKYLTKSFGGAQGLSAVQQKLESLARAYGDNLADAAYRLYERFRPDISDGVSGWGEKGLFQFEVVDELIKEANK